MLNYFLLLLFVLVLFLGRTTKSVPYDLYLLILSNGTFPAKSTYMTTNSEDGKDVEF